MDVLPPDRGDEVNLEHGSAEQKRIVEDLMENYDAAFAKHRYDTGSFTGFVASIDVNPEATHIEKEGPMKIDAKKCLRPIVVELVRHNILKLADT